MSNSNQSLQKLELLISKFLRIGVFISTTLMSIGWLLETLKGSTDFSKYFSYKEISFMESFSFALENNDWATIFTYLGLILLISLPIIRVLLTALLFIKQKDTILALIASSVFIILMLSMILGYGL